MNSILYTLILNSKSGDSLFQFMHCAKNLSIYLEFPPLKSALYQVKSAAKLVFYDLKSIRSLTTKAIWIDVCHVKKYGEVAFVLDSYLNA